MEAQQQFTEAEAAQRSMMGLFTQQQQAAAAVHVARASLQHTDNDALAEAETLHSTLTDRLRAHWLAERALEAALVQLEPLVAQGPAAAAAELMIAEQAVADAKQQIAQLQMDARGVAANPNGGKLEQITAAGGTGGDPMAVAAQLELISESLVREAFRSVSESWQRSTWMHWHLPDNSCAGSAANLRQTIGWQ